jgi:hypothetical protein
MNSVPTAKAGKANAAALRHVYRVALAMECGVPDEVCHIIAAPPPKAISERTTEAFIVPCGFRWRSCRLSPNNVKVK